MAAGRDAKRSNILKTAKTLCREAGPAALRMDRLAIEAGVAKGTLYLYFATREELLGELAREACGGWANRLAGEIAALEDPGARSVAKIMSAGFRDRAGSHAAALLPYAGEGSIAASVDPVIAMALLSSLPGLGSLDNSGRVWRAVRRLFAAFPASPAGFDEAEEAAGDLIRGAVRAQRARKKHE